MPTLCRLEYLTPKGWVVGHAGVALLYPERYVQRLADKGKFGRATELDDRLQPTGQVWEPDNLPDLATLVPTGTAIPAVHNPHRPCIFCDERHDLPHDGACLL